MICQLTSVLVAILFLHSTVVDAKTSESIEMKIFDRDLQVSDSEMHAMLKKANLTANGYKREVTSKLVQDGDGAEEYQKAYFFYKVVDCTKIQEVEQDLHQRLPDLIGKGVENKFKKEIKYRHLVKAGKCTVGLEVHFKKFKAGDCQKNQNAVSKRRNKRFLDCFLCLFCVVVRK